LLYHTRIFNIVRGNSMYPIISNGDFIVVNRFADDFKASDIIIFEKDSEIYVKQIKHITGYYYSRNFLDAPYYFYFSTDDYNKYSKSEFFASKNIQSLNGSYWVAGESDTSLNSDVFGPIKKSDILGKVVYIIHR